MQYELTCNLFFHEAFEFYNCAKIVKESEDRFYFEQKLSGPISFLIRHSMELILKAYIIRFEYEKGNENWSNKKYLENNRKLFSIHSIHELMNIITTEFSDKSLNISSKEKNVIETIDTLDRDSTFFRYPCNKNLKSNDKDFDRIDDREMFRTAPCCIGNILYHSDYEYYVDPNFTEDIIEVERTLFDTVKTLLLDYQDSYIEL